MESAGSVSSQEASTPSAPGAKINVALVLRPLLEHIDGVGATKCLAHDESEPCVAINGRSFNFDHVHGPGSPRECLFNHCMRDKLLPRLLQGFNVTVIAYGQTGSGKTHTMGSSTEASSTPGLIQDTMTYLYQCLPQRTACTVSCTQVYCEELHDLLPKDGPVLLQHKARALPVPHKISVKSPEDVSAVLQAGFKHRSTGATSLNNDSSRSHAIITFEFALPIGDGERDSHATRTEQNEDRPYGCGG